MATKKPKIPQNHPFRRDTLPERPIQQRNDSEVGFFDSRTRRTVENSGSSRRVRLTDDEGYALFDIRFDQ